VVVAFAIEHLRQIRVMRSLLAFVVVTVVLLNVYKLPAGGWILGVSDLRACCSETLRRRLEIDQTPERVVNRTINEVAGPMAQVLYVNNPFGALLTGTAIYTVWYNTRYSRDFAAASSDKDFASLISKIAPTHMVVDTTSDSPLEKLAEAYLQTRGTLLTRIGRLALFQL
jgi:hypothetical protein